jgi:hypothetical protein
MKWKYNIMHSMLWDDMEREGNAWNYKALCGMKRHGIAWKDKEK